LRRWEGVLDPRNISRLLFISARALGFAGAFVTCVVLAGFVFFGPHAQRGGTIEPDTLAIILINVFFAAMAAGGL